MSDDFPFSTYSDALLYKNEHANFETVIIKVYTTKGKEIVGTETVYSHRKTFFAVGMPILGALTLAMMILVFIFSPESENNSQY